MSPRGPVMKPDQGSRGRTGGDGVRVTDAEDLRAHRAKHAKRRSPAGSGADPSTLSIASCSERPTPCSPGTPWNRV